MVGGLAGGKTISYGADIAVLETIRLIMESSTIASRWPVALASIGSLIDAPIIEIISHNFKTKDGQIDLSSVDDAKVRQFYRDTFSAQNPLFANEQNFQPVGQIWHRHELISDHDYFGSAFYTNFLVARDMHHISLGAMRHDGQLTQVVVAARPRDMPAFSNIENDQLALLGPYLEHSLVVGARLAEAEQTLDASLTALDQIGHGLIILDLKDRSVIASNKQAKRTLDLTDLLVDEAGRLGLGPGPAGQEFEGILTQIEMGWNDERRPADARMKLPRGAGSAPLHLVILPLAQPPGSPEFRKLVLLIAVDPSAGTRIEPAQLRAVYGMTPAESKLCALLVAGATLDETATSLGITYNTARTHLKQIMAKTETERQADIVRVILSGPAPILGSSDAG